jgi:hypothetical protein
MFWPYTAIIRCLCLLKVFHCVSACVCDSSHLK